MAEERHTLHTAKAALDSGLITEADYACVKDAFLKAQQIRAGLDAGFIQESDYQQVKAAFLHALNLQTAPGASHALGEAAGRTADYFIRSANWHVWRSEPVQVCFRGLSSIVGFSVPAAHKSLSQAGRTLPGSPACLSSLFVPWSCSL